MTRSANNLHIRVQPCFKVQPHCDTCQHGPRNIFYVALIYTFKVSFAHCLECSYFLKAYSIVESMISTAPSTWCTRKTFRTHRPGMYLQGSILIDLGVISAHVGFLFASRTDHMYKGPRGMFRRHFRSSFAHLVTRNCILTKLHCSTKFGGFPDLPRKKRVGGLAQPLE